MQQQQSLIDSHEINKFTINADYQPNLFDMSTYNRTINGGFHDENDKMEATITDIIIPEYPADCFPENWYEKMPCCLEDTEFWRRWKVLR